ncbi:hypothetical protein M3Y98_01129900 [Aphelenchoides besseyi]|nr:hypothetical protein M3Y98_01129900 [Aphelenchoides besseyi]
MISKNITGLVNLKSKSWKQAVIASEGERLASRALSEAAKIIALSPTAIQLRYLQTLINISSEKNKAIVIPIPIELVRTVMNSRCCR